MYEKKKKMDSAVKAVLHSQLLPDFFLFIDQSSFPGHEP